MKKIHEELKKVFESKVLVGFLYGIISVIVLALIFSAGMSVGFHKASYGRTWSDNYERNFGMARGGGMMNNFIGKGQNFPNAHGAVGKIIKIELPNIIVVDKDNTEKVILIKDDTRIQKMMFTQKATDLNVDDFIIVIGSPNEQGQIEAKLIRVMPNPELLNNKIQINDQLPQ